VEVALLGSKATVTSGHDGAFEVTLQPPKGQRFAAGVHEVVATLAGGAEARARVEVVPDSTPLLVISDFDDTVAVSQVTDKGALLVNALLKDADSQEVVPGMADFYGCLRQQKPAAFALVSGSPVQFLPRVSSFLTRHRFPAFGLYLRDIGPTTLAGYKQPIIRRLLQQFPQPVVLVGDSGELDPEVYAQIREEFPGRVKAIYIRAAGRTEDAGRFKDMVLFQEAREAAEHAAGAGLAERACIARAFPTPEKKTEAGAP
jgi:phosphatidate phosphatase APP1